MMLPYSSSLKAYKIEGFAAYLEGQSECGRTKESASSRAHCPKETQPYQVSAPVQNAV